jgi:5-methylcytosine-specific restriction protein A
VTAGDLHRSVGGYPGQHHRMPVCCRAMRSALTQEDTILAQPPKGDGATLAISYRIPRPGGSPDTRILNGVSGRRVWRRI